LLHLVDVKLGVWLLTLVHGLLAIEVFVVLNERLQVILLHARRRDSLALALEVLGRVDRAHVLLNKHGLVVFVCVKHGGLRALELLEVLLEHLLLTTVVAAGHESAELLEHLLIVLEVVLRNGRVLGVAAVEELGLGVLVELLLHLLKLLNASVAV
jgi:hypothetical protein